jgi:hypothetical protein
MPQRGHIHGDTANVTGANVTQRMIEGCGLEKKPP